MERLPDNVIDFTVLKIKYDKQKICQCKNPTYDIDFENRLVTCSQCGAYTDPYDALVCLAMKPEQFRLETERLLEQRRQIVNYKPHMIVFRELENRYRKRKHGRMLPRCPQCGEPFFFEDIRGWVNEGFYNKKEDGLTDNEIKPCECGENGQGLRVFSHSGGVEYWVSCAACGENGNSKDTPEEAIAAWNKRAK
jgi:hypothetical protein